MSNTILTRDQERVLRRLLDWSEKLAAGEATRARRERTLKAAADVRFSLLLEDEDGRPLA